MWTYKDTGILLFKWSDWLFSGDREMSDDEVSNCSDDLVLPAVTIDQPAMPKQLPSGYWEEENDRLKQFCRLQINCILLILCAVLFFNGSLYYFPHFWKWNILIWLMKYKLYLGLREWLVMAFFGVRITKLHLI